MKKAKILIVDDLEANRQILAEIISSFGYKYAITSDGLEAIEELKNSYFDLVLLDIGMPNFDGFETVEYIRNNFDSPIKEIPIIAMTSRKTSTAKFNNEYESAGFNKLIEKPFSIDRLLNVINEYCD